jgi:hypothetical protein
MRPALGYQDYLREKYARGDSGVHRLPGGRYEWSAEYIDPDPIF